MKFESNRALERQIKTKNNDKTFSLSHSPPLKIIKNFAQKTQNLQCTFDFSPFFSSPRQPSNFQKSIFQCASKKK
jgi:hypothetical protein